jgi:hypothetical protein
MLVEYDGHTRSILRTVDDFGFESYDLVSVPTRLLGGSSAPPLVEANIDRRRVKPIPSPAQLAAARGLDDGDNWLALSSRSLARLYAAFLIAEDPQRRLDARKAATLMHQVSLVQHILEHPDLRKVLIGDEVGLGKTIEAGLLMRRLAERPIQAPHCQADQEADAGLHAGRRPLKRLSLGPARRPGLDAVGVLGVVESADAQVPSTKPIASRPSRSAPPSRARPIGPTWVRSSSSTAAPMTARPPPSALSRSRTTRSSPSKRPCRPSALPATPLHVATPVACAPWQGTAPRCTNSA